MKDFKEHLFRSDYQYQMHSSMKSCLPMDQAIVYVDFAQNYCLAPNDEIQSAHYVQKQVTIHTMFLMRHTADSTQENPKLTRESIACISDILKHATTSVHAFTTKLLRYMKNNPQKVGLPTVLHRITDNCAFEYKCKDAFHDIFTYQDTLAVKVVYHYGEPGHGKGPHDGIGATIKHGLDRLVVQDRVRLRNAYEVYLAASQNLSTVGHLADPSRKKELQDSKRIVWYMPSRLIKPQQRSHKIACIKGTMNLRAIHSINANEFEISSLSCSCPGCFLGTRAECSNKEWREVRIHRISSIERNN